MPNKKTSAPQSNKKAPSAQPYVIQNRTLSFDFSAEPESREEPAPKATAKAATPAAKGLGKPAPKAVTPAAKSPAKTAAKATQGVSQTVSAAKPPAGSAAAQARTGQLPKTVKPAKPSKAAKPGSEKKIRQVTPASQRIAAAAAPSGSATAPDGSPKVRRSRVPADLSQQYGEKISSRLTKAAPAVEMETKARRKRTTATEREDRKRQFAPDEGLLARLSKINALPLAPVKKEPRGSGWKFQCGRCGTSTRFETEAGLCPVCGAIALKDR